MSTAQRKIELERDCGRVAMALYSMGKNGMTLQEMTVSIAMKSPRIFSVVCELEDGELVYHDRASGYHLTSKKGMEYAELLKNSKLDTLASGLKFKEEALSGGVEKYNPKSKGLCFEKSKLKRAALPQKPEQRRHQTPEDKFFEAENNRLAKQHLARQLKIDVEKVEKYWNEGRLKECRECGNVEVFDKKLDRLQHVCRKCMKKRKGAK